MGFLEVDDTKIRALYQRAWVESGHGFVNPRLYPYLDRALSIYARANGCTYDQAYIFAKSGEKMWGQS
jgi:hypothetical protein